MGNLSDLVDLYEATQFAAEQIALRTARQELQTELRSRQRPPEDWSDYTEKRVTR